jgi:hypothetical protein
MSERRAIAALRVHPRNAAIYGDEADEALVGSVKLFGVLDPLLVTPKDVVISGHRRLDAARKAGLAEVEVIVRPVADDLEAIALILEANKNRATSARRPRARRSPTGAGGARLPRQRRSRARPPRHPPGRRRRPGTAAGRRRRRAARLRARRRGSPRGASSRASPAGGMAARAAAGGRSTRPSHWSNGRGCRRRSSRPC